MTTVLAIKELERYTENVLVFPSFDMEVASQEVVALYSSMNVRHTLLSMMLGRLPISSGEIRVNGVVLAGNRKTFASTIGYLLLDEGEYDRLTVKENFKFYKDLYDSSWKIDEVLRHMKLEQKVNVRLAKLTPSERRRVQYARLLFQNPLLFVLEEPDQNVDNETKFVFQKMILMLCEQGKGVWVLTGNMETAISVTNRVYRLDEKGLKAFDVHEEEEVQVQNQNQTTPMTESSSNVTNLGEEEDDGDSTDGQQVLQLVRFEKIPTKMNEKIILFNPPEIDYVESNEGQTYLYVNGESYTTTFKINELEERLHSYGFFRCHRSYIVNLQKVREVITFTRNSYSLILEDRNKSSVPLSKTKMAELKEMMGMK
ncbi:LytTR family transcriptional regulator DNA-binding domain-containing protein [Paenibacillus sp. N1-5-1-14]|uniref:LytTR family transcriptional regulator DNA-binding domain-containing protein n=1 Tax=Paenibacillus radicibacter TaxID=2972488 RepID=UPI002158C1B3|nr:LytTR family transcriptional regulator DNA-binding domain-containing protein [Paenibacillus radicibacter]MCR8643424.1 LytTR family transcriptional regulator DNA-binding domain-containing protein [Paenibacillus radicibacter]